MKNTYPLTTLVFIASAGSLLAQSAMERDFKQLAEQRDRALATAAEPVNRRYRADLEVLMRKATQAGDLPLALKIKDALAALGKEPLAEALPTVLAGGPNSPVGTWTFEGKDKRKMVRTFHKDGTITGDGFEGAGKWRLAEDKIIISYPERGDGWMALPLDPKGTKAQSHNGSEQIVIRQSP